MIFMQTRTICLHTITLVAVNATLLVLATGCTEILIPDPRVRYIAFGDSATAGKESNNYPELLRDLLGEPREVFALAGKGGERSGEGLARFKGLLNADIYPNAEVLLYWEGGNDVTAFITAYDPLLVLSPAEPDYPFTDVLSAWLDETEDNLRQGVEVAQGAGLRVFLATYYFLREDLRVCDALLLDVILPAQAARTNYYVDALNERIRSVAVESGAVLVDIASEDDAIRAVRENYSDCNHLSERGNAIVAEIFHDAITAADARSGN